MNESPPDQANVSRANTPSSARETEILRRLLFDETEYFEKLDATVNRASRFMRLDPRSGRVHLSGAATVLTVPNQIRLLLIGRKFAADLKLVATDRMNYREIAAELDRSPGGVSTELTDLARDRDVEKDENGLFFVPFHRIETTLLEFERQGSDRAAAEPATGTTEAEPRENGRVRKRRAQRQRQDPELQDLLAKPVDVTPYSWVKDLKSGLDRGLGALYVAREAWGKASLTCSRLATLLQFKFGVPATRGAISMAFLQAKGNLVMSTDNGKEIEYTLSTPGERYLEEVRAKVKANAQKGTLDALPSS